MSRKVRSSPVFECPQVCHPPHVITRQWGRAGNLLTDPEYEERWAGFFDRYAQRLYEINQSWDLDWDRFHAFVEHERLAEFHRLIATREPYAETQIGTPKSHPGWEIAQREERMAQRIGEDLGLRKKRTYTTNGGGSGGIPDDSLPAVVDDMADL